MPRCSDQPNESSAAHAKVEVAIATFLKFICIMDDLTPVFFCPIEGYAFGSSCARFGSSCARSRLARIPDRLRQHRVELRLGVLHGAQGLARGALPVGRWALRHRYDRGLGGRGHVAALEAQAVQLGAYGAAAAIKLGGDLPGTETIRPEFFQPLNVSGVLPHWHFLHSFISITT
jgi:hypothetical protein